MSTTTIRRALEGHYDESLESTVFIIILVELEASFTEVILPCGVLQYFLALLHYKNSQANAAKGKLGARKQ